MVRIHNRARGLSEGEAVKVDPKMCRKFDCGHICIEPHSENYFLCSLGCHIRLIMEAVNTGVEKYCDKIEPDKGCQDCDKIAEVPPDCLYRAEQGVSQ